jgi:photoactive yellow protein
MTKQNESNKLDAFSNISASQLRERVETLPKEVLDALPFGVIRVDVDGRVVFFSHAEAEQSGYKQRTAIGLRFFTELAPCMGTPEFRHQFELAQSSGKLDVTFQQVGDFEDAERELQVRAIAAAAGGMWLFIRRPRRAVG